MPEKKFDLNKVLQAALLYTPIEYGFTPQFDISNSVNNFNNTSNNVLSEIDWVGSSVRARKEEQEKRDNLPWYSKLGYQLMGVPQDTVLPLYSQSAVDRLMVGDYAGAEAIQKPINTVATIATGAGLLGAMGGAGLFNAAATYGWPAALAAEGLSWGAGTAGYYGFDKLGQTIDNKYGTNIRPGLSFVGSMGTGMAGYSAGLRTAAGLARSVVNNGIKGYSDFKPALTDMMIKYTKPMKLGNVSFSPSESHIRFFNTRGSESGTNTYFKTAKYAGNTGSYNGRVVPTWQLPKGQRNQPIKPKYENLKFIRHLSGLPNMEDGMVIASPKGQGISNWTTDLPFRRHQSYQKLPGTEYMIVDPEAFVGLKPLSIEPMDTMFLNSELRIHPKHITILSGNTNLLRKAEQLGMRTATTPELQTEYNNIIRKILEVQKKYESLPKSKGLNLTKPLSGLDALSDDAEGAAIHLAYRKAADDYFNSLPRPKYQAYHDMQKATGLNANVKLAKQLLKEFDDAVIKADSITPSTATEDIIFRYPGQKRGRTVWNMKNERRPDFYKHVGYAPSTAVENDLLLKLGLQGTEARHPAQATLEKIRPALDDYLKNIGALKQGGKI